MKLFILIPAILFISTNIFAQTDSAKQNPSARSFTHRDSLYLSKLNTSGNLMIAGGVALCAAGSYFIYEGLTVYNSPIDPGSSSPAADLQRNHNQGTAYLVAGGASIAGGIILGFFGVKNKIEFKHRLKYMSLQTGLLSNGDLGIAFTF